MMINLENEKIESLHLQRKSDSTNPKNMRFVT